MQPEQLRILGLRIKLGDEDALEYMLDALEGPILDSIKAQIMQALGKVVTVDTHSAIEQVADKLLLSPNPELATAADYVQKRCLNAELAGAGRIIYRRLPNSGL